LSSIRLLLRQIFACSTGTAHQSANAILVMSTIMLALMVVIYRKHLGVGALLTALVAALTAVVVGLVLAWL
jgi:hypothetical protein